MATLEIYQTRELAIQSLALPLASVDDACSDDQHMPSGQECFKVEELNGLICITISNEGISWEWESERVNRVILSSVLALIREFRRDRLVVDCINLDYVDHGSVNVFAQLSRALGDVNGRFAVCNIRKEILEVLRICRMPMQFV